MNASPDNGPKAAERLLTIVQELVRETRPGHAVPVELSSRLEADLALDSLARTELIQRIDQAFGIQLPIDALAEADTPRDLLRFLEQALPEQAVSSPVALHARPTAALPDHAGTLVEVLEWHVAHQPDRVHILLQDNAGVEQPLSYRGLLDAAEAVAAALVAKGIEPGQSVALMLPTSVDYLASFFGVMLAGGIAVPIYPPARMSQIEDHLRRHARILSNAQAKRIITVEEARPVAVMLQAAVPGLEAILTPSDLRSTQERAPRAAFRPRSDDIAFLQYTSGSTGEPKGVVLTHANLLANVRALGLASQVGPEDVFVSWLPLYHDMGLIGAWFGSLYHGIPLVLMSPLAFLARPAQWLQAITRHRGTISGAPNFAYELCVRHISDGSLSSLDLSSWRLAFNGAEPVNPATLESFAARFAGCGLRRESLVPVYGLAESSVGLAFSPLGRAPRLDLVRRQPLEREGKAVPADAADADILRIPSCGRALPGHEMRIVDDAGVEIPQRQIGRLEFRGPSATSGYYRNPEATAKLLHNGWLDTGDHAYLVEDEVYVTGRVKDLIKRGGRNLYPYDLEEAVGKLHGVRKGCVAVFASPDRATGTERLVVMAETRERDTTRLAALHDAVNQAALDVIGTPADDIVFVPPHAVLKTSSGKIRRLASREAYERGTTDQRPAAPWLHTTRFMASAVKARLIVAARRTGAWLYGGYVWGALVVLLPAFGGLMALLPRPALSRRVARSGARLLLRLAGATVAAIGLDRLPRQSHILLVNHASYLDGLVLTALLPAVPGYAFAAKRELAGWRLSRVLLGALGTVFIERSDARRGPEDVDLMVAALRRGDNLLVFPEGTFLREAGLKEFHTGAFLAAARTGVPVVAAGLRGTRTALREGTWLPRRARMTLEVGATFAPAGSDWRAVTALRDATRQAMVPLSGEFAVLHNK